MTYFVVLAFQKGKRGMLVADEPRQPTDELRARRMVMALEATHVGVLAFSRSGNPETGDWEDAVIIARSGAVPDEMLEALAA